MESLICRTLMLSGLIVGVLLAGGQGGQALVPAILALVGVAVFRRIAPSLPWRFATGAITDSPNHLAGHTLVRCLFAGTGTAGFA
ncbi:MAG: hypothetical protein IPJ73_07805 [Zoogloea sp.]|nr:hypothetical protein [Zoogloea sp.]